jgi:6-phosphogluconolactonase
MQLHVFKDDTTLATDLAGKVADAIAERLRRDGAASAVIAGGRTPGPFLRALARQPLDWSRVTLLLSDERRVPVDDPASNQRVAREVLTGTPASSSLQVIDATGDGALEAWRSRLSTVARPFAAVVLGMGEDGHIASLFPGMPGLAAALDMSGPATVVAGLAPVEPRARLSLSLAALLDTDLLVLHVTGASKLAVVRQASVPTSELDLPVRALLQQRRVPVHVFHTAGAAR